MSINNQIEALSIKNTMVKPVNMTEFNNPFLLLSSTKALNELVVNTNPSSRAKVANIEPTKSKYQQNPLGVPIDVYTKDTATGAKVSRKKLKVDAISKLSKQTASSALSSALSNIGKKAKAKKEQQASLKAAVKKGSMKAAPAKASNVKAPKASAGGGKAPAKAGGGKAPAKRGPGAPNRGIGAAKEANAAVARAQRAANNAAKEAKAAAIKANAAAKKKAGSITKYFVSGSGNL